MCEHKDFEASVAISRLEDIGRFAANVRVHCNECGVPFQFIGLPCGLNLEGAAVSVDGTEARLAIAPRGQAQPALSGVKGFHISASLPSSNS